MLTEQSRPPATGAASPPDVQPKVRISRVTPAGVATVTGAAAGSLGLVWVLYERVLPFTGVLGFWVCWYVAFLLFYAALARLQWDRRDVSQRVSTVAFGTSGTVALLIVIGIAAYTLTRGFTTKFKLFSRR